MRTDFLTDATNGVELVGADEAAADEQGVGARGLGLFRDCGAFLGRKIVGIEKDPVGRDLCAGFLQDGLQYGV